MKHLILTVVLTLCFAGLSSAQQKDFEIKEGLMRSEFIKMSPDEQKQVFRDADSKTKAKIYKYKIVSDLKNDDVPEEDKAVLKKLRKELKPSLYEGSNSKGEMEDIVKEAGWDELKQFKYLEMYETLDEIKGTDKEKRLNEYAKTAGSK